MSEHQFDTFTRGAGSGLSRRSSLLSLGAIGLAAIAAPVSVSAKKNRKKRKKNKVAPACPPLTEDCSDEIGQTCTRQKDECNAFFLSLCREEGAPEDCAAATEACCELLGTCQAGAYIECFMNIIRGARPVTV